MGASLFVKDAGLPPLSPQQKEELECRGETILTQIKRDTALILRLTPADAEVVAVFDYSYVVAAVAPSDFVHMRIDNMVWLSDANPDSLLLQNQPAASSLNFLPAQVILPLSSVHDITNHWKTKDETVFDMCTDECPKCPVSFNCYGDRVPFAYSLAIAAITNTAPARPDQSCYNLTIGEYAWRTVRKYYRQDRRFIPSLAMAPNERMLIGVRKLFGQEYTRFTRIIQIPTEKEETTANGKREEGSAVNSDQRDIFGRQCTLPGMGGGHR